MFRDPHPKLALLIAIAALAACTQDKTATSNGPIRKPSATAYETAAPKGVPDWIPIYPGSRVDAIESRNAGVETYIDFRLEAPADCDKVNQWYLEKLRLAGFDMNVPTECGILRGEGPGNTRHIRMVGIPSNDGRSSFSITAIVRAASGQTPGQNDDGRLPGWIPQYPRSTPSNVVSSNEGGERHIVFNFSTGDNAQAVIGWYEQKLKQAQFTIVTSDVFDAATAKMTAQDSTGRSILNLRMEPAGNTKVVSIETRETK